MPDAAVPASPDRSDAATPPAATPAGVAMAATLKAAHRLLRRDLESIEQAARLIAAGDADSISEARGRIDKLSIRRTAWQLRSFCENYCQVVHTHHSIEDFRIFPAALALKPTLAPVIKRLTADHVKLGSLLDALIAAIDVLPDPEASPDLPHNVARELADHLATHLDLEEEYILPALSLMPNWI